jgi:hypothetical protein
MKVICDQCGLPFSVARIAPGRPVYCCSGCALAARVPVDAQGQFPVNAALGTALTLAFVGFNQVLFWLLAVLLARDPEAEVNALRFGWASLGTGTLFWMVLSTLQWRLGARSSADAVVFILSGCGLFAAFSTAYPAHAAVANLVLAGWSLRGLHRKRPPTA